jgi:hypothetical protein
LSITEGYALIFRTIKEMKLTGEEEEEKRKKKKEKEKSQKPQTTRNPNRSLAGKRSPASKSNRQKK